MSGPKSFSVSIFNSKLNEIFSLQSQINQLFRVLQNYALVDKELSISFDCQDFISKNEEGLKKQLKSFELGYKGDVDQKKYDGINDGIETKINKLKQFLEKANNEKKSFLDKRQDYQSYVSYKNYYKKSHQSFGEFKSELTAYLAQNIKKEKPELFKKSKEEIAAIKPTIKQLEFEFGFRKKEQQSKQKVTEHIDEKENEASEVRNKIAKDMLVKLLAQKKQVISAEQKNETIEIAKLVEVIEKKIDAFENEIQSKKFQTDFKKLQKSEVFKDVYFYKELSDRIGQASKTQIYKRQIKDLLYELNTSEIIENLQTKKNSLLNNAVDLLESEVIKQYKYEDFEAQCHFLKEENKKLAEDKFVKQKANEFLKAELVNGLKNMNYQVMDDMEVIDFEKQSDFLFKVPEQSNYINLRIGKDNSIAYNFLIEEDKKELSIDEKREKVVEMESTCKSFKEVLSELEALGLDIDQTKASEADMEKLMQVPKKYSEKIKKAKKEQDRVIEESNLKKKYLDGS